MSLTFRNDYSRIGRDLVICMEDNFSFDNRWRFTNDLVDYRTVEVWDGSRLREDCSGLKRIKIFGGLPYELMSALLRRLSDTAKLEHLEIDRLEIKQGAANWYNFEFLKRFSVDEIRVVDEVSEVTDATDKLKLNVYGSENLVSLYFGK